MKNPKLLKKWNDAVSVAKEQDPSSQHHSPRDVNQQQAARGWLAFNALNERKEVKINPYGTSFRAMDHYRELFQEKLNKWGELVRAFKNCDKDNLAVWAGENPHNLLLLYRDGADIMTRDTHCLSYQSMHLHLACNMGIIRNTHCIDDTQSEEIFYKLFNKDQEQAAISLMENTVSRRIQTAYNRK